MDMKVKLMLQSIDTPKYPSQHMKETEESAYYNIYSKTEET